MSLPTRWAAALAALSFLPLSAAAPAAGAAALPTLAPFAHAGTPTLLHHASVPSGTVYSENWSGYAATGGTFTSVNTTFTQPAVNCTKTPNSSAAFWVGLDGYSSSTVEQTGITAQCVGSTAAYTAWYEMYPQAAHYYNLTVVPGDTIYESVQFSGTDVYTLTISDQTRNWTENTVADATGDARSSAEVIVEASNGNGFRQRTRGALSRPDSGGVSLADFAYVDFPDSIVNNIPLHYYTTPIYLVGTVGDFLAEVSTFSGDDFTDTWVAAT